MGRPVAISPSVLAMPSLSPGNPVHRSAALPPGVEAKVLTPARYYPASRTGIQVAHIDLRCAGGRGKVLFKIAAKAKAAMRRHVSMGPNGPMGPDVRLCRPCAS